MNMQTRREELIDMIREECGSGYQDVIELLQGHYPIYPDPHRQRRVCQFLQNTFSQYGKWKDQEALRMARELGYDN